MKKLGITFLAIAMTFSATALPSLANAQQNDPIPYIRDGERVRPEDRRTISKHDVRRNDNKHHDARRHGPNRHHDDNDLAIGVLGLATGAIIGGIIADDRRYDPAPRPRFRPPVKEHRYSMIRPWSPAWYRWCSNKYRSFNPNTGTFIAYDGVRQFCNAHR